MKSLKSRELKAQETAQILESAGRFLAGVKDLAVELAKQPAFQVVGSVVMIESLQRMKYPNGDPVISQTLANLMEGTIITTSTLNSIGGLTGLTGLLGAFKK